MRLRAVVAVLAAGCTGALEPSSYEASCRVAEDCVVVALHPCAPCVCPDAAISRSSQARYQADADWLSLWCPHAPLPCPECPEATATCDAGRCGVILR